MVFKSRFRIFPIVFTTHGEVPNSRFLYYALKQTSCEIFSFVRLGIIVEGIVSVANFQFVGQLIDYNGQAKKSL